MLLISRIISSSLIVNDTDYIQSSLEMRFNSIAVINQPDDKPILISDDDQMYIHAIKSTCRHAAAARVA